MATLGEKTREWNDNTPAKGEFFDQEFDQIYQNEAELNEKKFEKTGGEIDGDVAITGNLTVEGNTVQLNVENYTVKDRVITLNNGEIGSGVSGDGQSGFEIDRGPGLDKVRFVWDESEQKIKSRLGLTPISIEKAVEADHAVEADYATEAGNALAISDGVVSTTDKLANGIVTSEKLASGALIGSASGLTPRVISDADEILTYLGCDFVFESTATNFAEAAAGQGHASGNATRGYVEIFYPGTKRRWKREWASSAWTTDWYLISDWETMEYNTAYFIGTDTDGHREYYVRMKGQTTTSQSSLTVSFTRPAGTLNYVKCRIMNMGTVGAANTTSTYIGHSSGSSGMWLQGLHTLTVSLNGFYINTTGFVWVGVGHIKLVYSSM